MLHIIIKSDNRNYKLPDAAIEKSKEFEEVLKERFKKIMEEYPNEEITVTCNLINGEMNGCSIQAAEWVLIRLNELDNASEQFGSSESV